MGKEHRIHLHTCVICGLETQTERHHCVPKRALQPQGIKGTDNPVNLVNVCSNGDNDCHEVLDQKAIRERLFWNGEGFVPISQMPKETYVEVSRYSQMPRVRRHHK